MGKSIEQLRDEYISKKLEGNTLHSRLALAYFSLLCKTIREADTLYPMPTEKICTGCDRSNLEHLGVNPKRRYSFFVIYFWCCISVIVCFVFNLF